MSTGKTMTASDLKKVAPSLPWYYDGASDVDTCVTPGVWKLVPTTLNKPWGTAGYGLLRVSVAGDIVEQTCTKIGGPQERFYRIEGGITSSNPTMSAPFQKVTKETVT